MLTPMLLMFVAGGFAGVGGVAAAQGRLESAGVFVLGMIVFLLFSILQVR